VNRLRHLTVRGRVTLAAIGVLALGLAVICIGINLLLANRLDGDASSALRDRAEAQLATLDTSSGAIKLEENRNEAALDQHSWVFAANGRPLEKAPAAPAVLRAVGALAGVSASTERELNDRVRLRAVPVYGPGHSRVGTVVVGVSLQPYEDSRRFALLGTIALSALLLLLGAVLVRRAVGAALKPVADMAHRAADWGEQDLHRRFELGPQQDELGRLAATFNGLLERIEGVLRHEQRFSAEMAHELRTPLAGLRTEAELALASALEENELRDSLARVVVGTERMTRVIETLLTSARADALAPPGSCEAAGPMTEAVAALEPTAEERGVAVSVYPPVNGGSIQAPADLVAHALQPLIENAVRHASSRVTVSARSSPGQVAVIVEDDGSGLGQADPEELFGPGASDTGGAGLGLPLARRLARSSGGDVVAVPALRGARFELRLPMVGKDRTRSEGPGSHRRRRG
jgi:signal transduction histidine kinase